MLRLSFLLCALLLTASAHAAQYLGHEHDAALGRVTIKSDAFEIRMRALVGGGLSVVYDEDDTHHSYALTEQAFSPNVVVSELDDRLVLQTEDLRAVVHKFPLRLAFFRGDEWLFEEQPGYVKLPGIQGLRFRINEGDRFWGGGERILGMDRKGHRLALENKPHYGYTTESNQMYYSIPAVISDRAYLIAFDNPAKGVMDLGAQKPDVLKFEAPAGEAAYVVLSGSSLLEVSTEWARVSGLQPLPPQWALGNFASRFGYRTQSETESVVQAFKQAGVGLDAIVLDLYWFGETIQGTMGNLEWFQPNWPNPTQMLSDFQKDGVKTVLITEPFILTQSKQWAPALKANALAKSPAGDPQTFDFYFGNTGLVDVFGERGRAWFWGIYERLLDQGVAGIWGDLGEPEVHPDDTVYEQGSGRSLHNAYGHEWARLLYEGITARSDERPFIMMRAGFLGSQRYGMIPWTGDVDRSWGGLTGQVELALQMGAFGLAYIHSDLGGFAGGEVFDPELYYRWLAMGVFSPVFRPHAQDHIPPEPVFHDSVTLERARDLINLRYAMLPYNYHLAYENATSGLPLARPVAFYSNAPDQFTNRDQYYWGRDILVQPVVTPGLERAVVRLPQESTWFDFWNPQRGVLSGSVEVDLKVSSIPVFVRAGAFIPLAKRVPKNTAEYDTSAIELHYFYDASQPRSQSSWFTDDGRSHDSLAAGQFEITDFYADSVDDSLELRLSNRGSAYANRPDVRFFDIKIHGLAKAPTAISVNGQVIDEWRFDQSEQRLQVTTSLLANNEALIRVEY